MKQKVLAGAIVLGLACGAYSVARNMAPEHVVETRQWTARPGEIDDSNNPQHGRYDRFETFPVLDESGMFIRGYETRECRPVRDAQNFRYAGLGCQTIKTEMFR